MESRYDLRRGLDGKWEVFSKETGKTAVVGGLSLTAFDRITANGIVGLLNRKIITTDGSSADQIGRPQDPKG
jgi:hypothetical protein